MAFVPGDVARRVVEQIVSNPPHGAERDQDHVVHFPTGLEIQVDQQRLKPEDGRSGVPFDELLADFRVVLEEELNANRARIKLQLNTAGDGPWAGIATVRGVDSLDGPAFHLVVPLLTEAVLTELLQYQRTEGDFAPTVLLRPGVSDQDQEHLITLIDERIPFGPRPLVRVAPPSESWRAYQVTPSDSFETSTFVVNRDRLSLRSSVRTSAAFFRFRRPPAPDLVGIALLWGSQLPLNRELRGEELPDKPDEEECLAVAPDGALKIQVLPDQKILMRPVRQCRPPRPTQFLSRLEQRRFGLLYQGGVIDPLRSELLFPVRDSRAKCITSRCVTVGEDMWMAFDVPVHAPGRDGPIRIEPGWLVDVRSVDVAGCRLTLRRSGRGPWLSIELTTDSDTPRFLDLLSLIDSAEVQLSEGRKARFEIVRRLRAPNLGRESKQTDEIQLGERHQSSRLPGLRTSVAAVAKRWRKQLTGLSRSGTRSPSTGSESEPMTQFGPPPPSTELVVSVSLYDGSRLASQFAAPIGSLLDVEGLLFRVEPLVSEE